VFLSIPAAPLAQWELQRTRETPLPFCAGCCVACKRCTALLLGIDGTLGYQSTHRRPFTQGLEERRTDARVKIRDGDHSAIGIAPVASTRYRLAGDGHVDRDESNGCRRRANFRVKRSVRSARGLIGRSLSPEGDKEVRLSVRAPTKHWSNLMED